MKLKKMTFKLSLSGRLICPGLSADRPGQVAQELFEGHNWVHKVMRDVSNGNQFASVEDSNDTEKVHNRHLAMKGRGHEPAKR